MCSGQEQLNHETLPSSDIESLTMDMSNQTRTVDTESSSSSLLEFAANNDIEGFEQSFMGSSTINEVGVWYERQSRLKKMVCEERTPLMIAARYGSVDVVKLTLSLSEVDVNFSCGLDKSTALHCAASGGSANVLDVVKLLLFAGADTNATDVNGHRPFDVIVTPLNLPELKVSLEELLKDGVSICLQDMHLSSGSLTSSLTSLSSSPEPPSVCSISDSTLSPVTCMPDDIHVSSAAEKKEYPVDPSLPDINNSMFATDEFRMFSFKIHPCSRAYSHDWTECPFVHPGENARRRDLRKYHYSCVPCPDFRKGTCKHGDLCEYAHGVFECWLHPAQYKTRLCKDGVSCARRVCFFAHTADELRPLYISTGSALPSPRSATSASVMDMSVALGMLPGSPSAVSAMSPSPFTPPMSPSGNGIAHSSMVWPPQNIPTLHLPCSNFQSSRLRSSFSARDIPGPAEEFNTLQGLEMQQQQLLHDLSCLSQPHISTSSPSLSVRSKTLTPSNLAELLATENSSPQYTDQLAASSLFSPPHKSVFLNQLQQQQSMLSPIKTNMFSAKNVDNPFLEGSFGVSSPGRMSPRHIESLSPMNTRLSALAHQEKQQLQFRSLSSRDLGSNLPQSFGSIGAGNAGSPVNSWSKWESPNGKVDWSVQADELGCLHKSCSIGHNGEEPDVSWVHSLVKETPFESKEMPAVSTSGKKLSAEVYNFRNMG